MCILIQWCCLLPFPPLCSRFIDQTLYVSRDWSSVSLSSTKITWLTKPQASPAWKKFMRMPHTTLVGQGQIWRFWDGPLIDVPDLMVGVSLRFELSPGCFVWIDFQVEVRTWTFRFSSSGLYLKKIPNKGGTKAPTTISGTCKGPDSPTGHAKICKLKLALELELELGAGGPSRQDAGTHSFRLRQALPQGS